MDVDPPDLPPPAGAPGAAAGEGTTGAAVDAAAGETQSFNVLGARFECPPRYSLIRPIGQGAYGLVCSAVDHVTGERCAIKKIAGIIENEVDCKRTLREMRLLRHFRHENVIAIKDVYVPAVDGPAGFNDVYTVTELMDTDLHQIITSNQELSDEHCQYFLYQILKALKHIHSASVLHRDLKPSNILVNGNCDLKVCDFGLARVAEPAGDASNLTVYVATRWYRAPEIIMQSSKYGPAVDMWSVGCILGEILGRRPLFRGKDPINQLQLIIDVLGTPPDSYVEHIDRENARCYMQSQPRKMPRPLVELFPAAPPPLLDLLGQMLAWDPSHRITVEAALEHPYLADLHDTETEPECQRVFDIHFAAEQAQTPKETLRRLVYDEVCIYHPELR
jgi:serine/threonine protein kinase